MNKNNPTTLIRNPPRKKKTTRKTKIEIEKNKETTLTMTNYTNCLSLEQMEYLDLFDNIPYKDIKKIVKMDDDTDFQVEIKDLPNDSGYMCSTSFKFTIEIDISQGSLPLMVEKHYCVIKEYNSSSEMALYILTFVEEEEEEESSEEESSEEEEERPVIHRAGGVNWENYHRMVEAGIITPIHEHLRESIHEHLREESSEEESSEEEEETKEPSQ